VREALKSAGISVDRQVDVHDCSPNCSITRRASVSARC
jgi:hypothetical protein